MKGGRMPPGASRANQYAKRGAVGPFVGSLRALRRALGIAAGCLLFGPAFAASSPPVAVEARLVDEGGGAKLTFDLSAPIEAHAFAMVDPDRIIIDVPEVNFQIDPAWGRAPQGRALGQIVKSYRFGLFGPGKSRIVIDLAAPARVTRIVAQPIA